VTFALLASMAVAGILFLSLRKKGQDLKKQS
jgi:hypothetical protein